MNARNLFLLALLASMGPVWGEEIPAFEGSVERLDPALDSLLAPNTEIEVLATGFNWSEGPTWFTDRILFSDVPENTVYQWKEGDATASVFLKPSGLTGTPVSDRPQGSNGLAVNASGELILCQHGDRRVARLTKDGRFVSLVDRFEGHRFNSPNDVVVARDGTLYFTDPPYGLDGLNDSPQRETGFNGVYRLTPNGEIRAIIRDLTFPNGIALSPSEDILYVAVSDPEDPHIRSYSLDPTTGAASNGTRLFGAESLKNAATLPGSFDGMAVSKDGHIWTTAPGGVIILTPEGVHLGSILTGQRTGNCTFGGTDGSDLYITADMFLLRVRTLTQGLNHMSSAK